MSLFQSVATMKTDTAAPRRIFVRVGSQEQQDNAKNSRKTMRVLQQAATDKENLVGRVREDKDSKSSLITETSDKTSEAKRKKMVHRHAQTGECTITEKDLTSSEEPSEDYWRLLAEKRGAALNDSFKENERLKDQVDTLKEENKICKELLDESRNLVEVLQEIIGEQDDSAVLAEGATDD